MVPANRMLPRSDIPGPPCAAYVWLTETEPEGAFLDVESLRLSGDAKTDADFPVFGTLTRRGATDFPPHKGKLVLRAGAHVAEADALKADNSNVEEVAALAALRLEQLAQAQEVYRYDDGYLAGGKLVGVLKAQLPPDEQFAYAKKTARPRSHGILLIR